MNLRFFCLVAAGTVCLTGGVLAQAPAGLAASDPAVSELASAAAVGTQSAGTQSVAGVVAPEALPAAALPRDPFWPVGYVPRRIEKLATSVVVRTSANTAPAPVVAVNAVDWDEARRHVEIRGISRIARDRTSGKAAYFAVVGDRMIEEGDAVSVTWNGRVYRWRVTQIGPAGLQMVKMDSRSE